MKATGRPTAPADTEAAALDILLPHAPALGSYGLLVWRSPEPLGPDIYLTADGAWWLATYVDGDAGGGRLTWAEVLSISGCTAEQFAETAVTWKDEA